MNKKGIFFTLISIAAISLFLISFTFYKNYQERDTIHQRIETLNTFIHSIEEDIGRQIFISGFRALLVMQTESVENGFFIPNATNSLNELFYNGTFNLNPHLIMNGAKYSDIQASISQTANKLNADVFITNSSIYFNQSDPWNVDAVFTVRFTAQDQGNLVSWDKTKTFISKIPINNFEDPLYLLNTAGIVTNKIKKTPFINFTVGSNVDNLNNHSINKYYKSSNQAPSYLNRLQGSNIPNENGIESFVYIPQLSNQGITPQSKSVVDYIYFSSNNPSSCNINGMPSWFRVDINHLQDYELLGLEYGCT